MQFWIPGYRFQNSFHNEKRRMAKKTRRGSKRPANYKTKGPKAHPKAIICRSPGVCPDVMQVVLTYNRQGSLSGIAPQSQVFRANSLFDPDFTGVGSQPLGFDQWAAFYRRYRVRASAIRVRYGNNAVSFAQQLLVAALNTNTVVTSQKQAMESNFKKVGLMTMDNGTTSDSVSMFLTTAQMRGAPPDVIEYNQDLTARVTTNPNDVWYWHVMGLDATDTGGTLSVPIEVEIKYYVEFYDRETLSAS